MRRNRRLGKAFFIRGFGAGGKPMMDKREEPNQPFTNTSLDVRGPTSFGDFDGQNQLGNTHRISLMFTLESEKFKRSSEE